ncbi:beta-porphyranase B [Bacteroidota bacterium]
MRRQTFLTTMVLFMAFGLFAQDITNEPGSGPPPPPEGYKWVVNEEFTDEFNGDQLDGDKWYSRSPYWIHGRAPATFRAYAVSVKDGNLQIKNSVLEGDERYNIAGGAVGSVSRDAHYGYYECRMKASSISMSSTFWMKNTEAPIGECGTSRQELDIVEAVGMQKTGWDFRNFMKSNTHFSYRDCEGKRQRSASAGGECAITPAANEAYHVYGCWWEDANNIHFYHNGEFKYTIHPDTTYYDKPFERPMYMHMVTETYNWESPPTPEELADDSRNTTYYDWVRSYKLVPDK